MRFGNTMEVRKGREMGRRKGMGRAIRIRAEIEMGMVEKRMEREIGMGMWTQWQMAMAMVMEMMRGTGIDLVRLMPMGFALVKSTGTRA